MAGEKEVDLLLSAWSDIERRTGARLVLVGDGPSRRSLRRTPGGQRAVWLPFERDREKLAWLYAAVDVCISPGSLETFGLSAIEALASGTPVLSADEGGVAENVRLSGGGRLFASRDRASLTEEAIALLGDDLATLGAHGRRYVEVNHGWERVLDGLFEIYRGVLGA